MLTLQRKQSSVYRLWSLIPLAIALIGCGSRHETVQQPTFELRTTGGDIQPLDEIEALVDSKDFEGAETRLKSVDISMIPTNERDRLAFLTARITLAQKPNAGCRNIAHYAQVTTNTLRKTKSVQLAIRCLSAPTSCAQIKLLSKSLLDDLKAMIKGGLLEKRLGCENKGEVINALVAQQRQFSKTDADAMRGVDSILKVMSGDGLKNLLPRLGASRELEDKVRIRLLSDFLSLLSPSEQKRFILELDKKHPVRLNWESTTRGNRVLVCLPLTGEFGGVGQSILLQLKALQTMEPPLFESTLKFTDCGSEVWSESQFDITLDETGAQFVLSLTDTPLQVRLSTHLQHRPQITHFTLNPIYPGSSVAKNTWTLNVSPDLLVGTLVSDALTRLNRDKKMPLPLRLILVTSAQRHSPIKMYLKQYESSFNALKFVEIPKTCSKAIASKACANQQQSQWMQLAQKVSKLTAQKVPFDTLYLDLEPDETVSFLKYFTSENIELSASRSGQAKIRKNGSTLIYSDHRPVHTPESQLSMTDNEGLPTGRVLRNRFTRLSGSYSDAIRYLVHFNPLTETASAFMNAVTQILRTNPRPEVITLTEALRLIDAMVKTGRKGERQTYGHNRAPIVYQAGHTSGLSIAPGGRTLPRLSILVTKDGYFRSQ